MANGNEDDKEVAAPLEEEDIELDAIGLYQAADVEGDLDPDLRDTVDDMDLDAGIESAHNSTPSKIPVADVLLPVTISEIIAAQKTDDFCKTVFATICQAKSFFFEG